MFETGPVIALPESEWREPPQMNHYRRPPRHKVIPARRRRNRIARASRQRNRQPR